MTFSPAKLALWASGIWCGTYPNGQLSGFGIDTRKLHAGQIFIAIKTKSSDGHLYLAEAMKNGATAAIVDREIPDINLPQLVVSDVVLALMNIAKCHRLEFTGEVIGITGSCGKTPSGWDDCKNGPFGSERHELTPADQNKRISFNGNVWRYRQYYSFSFIT